MKISLALERYSHWLSATRDLSSHTLRAYETDLSCFERCIGLDAAVQTIDHSSIVAFIEAQKAAGLSSASLRRRTSALRGFCRWLCSQGLLESDPFSGAEIALGKPRRLPRPLPAHELRRLMEFLRIAAGVQEENLPSPDLISKKPRQFTDLLAVALLVATGARVNEVVSIRCVDIDLQERTIRLMGKGRRERQVFLTNNWIASLTEAYIAARPLLDLQHALLLFNFRRAPLTPSAMRSRVVQAALAAGLHTRVTPHMLRHTAATQLIESGVDIRYIQRLLGHASLSTTEIYTHVSDRSLRSAVSGADVLGRFLEG